MRARAVSAPTASARKVKLPQALTVPAKTLPPTSFSTGMLSPVSIDSSTLDAPSTISPSTGMRSPGRTTMRSPGRTSLTGTSRPPSSPASLAVSGRRLRSFRSAAEVPPRARASR